MDFRPYGAFLWSQAGWKIPFPERYIIKISGSMCRHILRIEVFQSRKACIWIFGWYRLHHAEYVSCKFRKLKLYIISKNNRMKHPASYGHFILWR